MKSSYANFWTVFVIPGLVLILIAATAIFVLIPASGSPRKITTDFPFTETDITAVSTNPEQMARAQLEFKIRCSRCHGVNGEGSRSAPDLTDGVWKYGTGEVSQIYTVIYNGIEGTEMPGWGQKLVERDILALAIYVRYLQQMKP